MKLNPPTTLSIRPGSGAFGSTTGTGGAFGSAGGGTALGSPGCAFGVLVVPGGGVVEWLRVAGAGAGVAAVVDGAGAAVVLGGGTGSGSALEVAGNAMVTALALVTAAIASAAHSPLRRVEFGST